VRDGQAGTRTVPARTTAGSLAVLQAVEPANPPGALDLMTAHRSRHQRAPRQAGWAGHPRGQPVVLPTGAGGLTRMEAGWRLVRRVALAGQPVVDGEEIAPATGRATQPLNGRATPWVWGRPPRHRRRYRRHCVYRL